MLRNKLFGIAVIFLLGFFSRTVHFLVAQEQDSNVIQPIEELPSLAIQMESVIEAVLKHHIEPPARQQLVLEVMRSAVDIGESLYDDLSETVSNANGRDELYRILAAEFETRGINQNPPAELIARIEERLYASVPGGLRFVSQPQHRIDEQFAANQYVGIGVAINKREEGLQFHNVLEGGTASEAGIVAGDILESVDGKSTKNVNLTEAVQWLRGLEGISVKVSVRTPGQEPREIDIVRRIVPFKHVFLETETANDKAAHLRIESISASSVHEIRKIVDELPQSVTTLIMDLRRAQPGKLHHLNLLADGLLNQAIIGEVRTRAGVRTLHTDAETFYGQLKPVIVYSSGLSDPLDWLAKVAENHGIAVYYDRTIGPQRNLKNRKPWVLKDVIAIDKGDRLIEITIAQLHAAQGIGGSAHIPAGKPFKSEEATSNKAFKFPVVTSKEVVSNHTDIVEVIMKDLMITKDQQ